MLFALVVFALIEIALGGAPEVPCPVPLSPEHGQSFLYHDGQVVKYVCEPGYVLKGKEIVRCVDGQWEDPNPTCVEFGESAHSTQPGEMDNEPPLPAPPRPLFDWNTGDDSAEDERNLTTAEEVPLSDEARVRLLLYPARRAPVMTTRAQSVTESEEEKKRSQEDPKTVYLESPPPVVYVRRTIFPGKSETSRKALEGRYRTAPLRVAVENGQDVEVVSVPRAAVAQNDKGQQYDDYWRQLYYYNHYNYPRAASMVEYRNGAPVVVTLTDSQLAWVNSLHPELRDQYLKDMYVVRVGDHAESERAQAIIRRYDDAYSYYNYHLPYLRQPVSLVVEDPVAKFDYSCHQSGQAFVKAPRLAHAQVARYDRRQNPNHPRNHYLTAIYRCNPGYMMLDTRFTELNCSNKQWVGVRPVCVRRN